MHTKTTIFGVKHTQAIFDASGSNVRAFESGVSDSLNNSHALSPNPVVKASNPENMNKHYNSSEFSKIERCKDFTDSI